MYEIIFSSSLMITEEISVKTGMILLMKTVLRQCHFVVQALFIQVMWKN